jgi:sensor histidine kinase YesM
MDFFRKYIYPPLYGLLIYTVIRVINDTVAAFRFWERDWIQNLLEIAFSMLAGYLFHYVFRRLFRFFDRKLDKDISYKTVFTEVLWMILITEVVVNIVFTPMAALTDDGLSWGDFAIINIIPLLFNLIAYGLVRSQKLLHSWVQSKVQLEKITNDHLQTELKFLKAQYHPHFLFNALNTVYFQMDENVGEAKRTVEKFSELLRYQLYDQQQTVPVSREIHYLENFIDIQRIRTSERLGLSVHFDPSLNGQQVYPLLFLPLVENAFKYVGGNYNLSISVNKIPEGIELSVANDTPVNIKPAAIKGIGLENLKRRLELLYPGRHELTIQQKADHFNAVLKLKF